MEYIVWLLLLISDVDGDYKDHYCDRLSDLMTLPANEEFWKDCHDDEACEEVFSIRESCPAYWSD